MSGMEFDMNTAGAAPAEDDEMMEADAADQIDFTDSSSGVSAFTTTTTTTSNTFNTSNTITATNEDDLEEDEELLTAEEIAWEKSATEMSAKIQQQFEEEAQKIAEKVQRQQEGKESAMLEKQHEDNNFMTVDDIKLLLDSQMKTNSKYAKAASSSSSFVSRYTRTESTMAAAAIADPEVALKLGEWFLGRAKYIPVRLSYEERKCLRQCKALMRGHEYTQKVDGKKYKSSARRSHAKVKAIASILTGMITCLNSQAGASLAKKKDFVRYKNAIASLFEIGRRYKIMNPDRMRGEYGKMLYLLQDCAQPDIQEYLGFNVCVPVKTVYDLLAQGNGLKLLLDPHVCTATAEILPENKSRAQIQHEIKQKETAKKYLSKKYSNRKLTKDDIELCLNSICDNNNFLNSNRKPIDRMLVLLDEFFHPSKVNPKDPACSLAIGGGDEIATGVGVVVSSTTSDNDTGTRLSHSHEKQYMYVLQSLTLWREIVHDLFRLWWLSESDLLDSTVEYDLRNTGQGDQRVQSCNRISKAMHGILYAVQQKSSQNEHGWVGSSVIHLGDSNVPNAFMFIDKYNQVSRLLNPIDNCLRHIDIHMKNKSLNKYITCNWGSAKGAKRAILQDFFKYGFDGSGADNFFEAGSCIDGRLTSAWNWCQDLPSKPYFPLFKLSGFLGFDGLF
jgi:hypothetical protein